MTAKRVAFYLRVSTTSQTTENQRRELELTASRHGWEVVKVYEDFGISGAKGKDERPQLGELMRGVTRKEFDIVAVWSVDRLGRSLQDLLGVLSELEAKGVDLYLHQQGIDTTTPGGKALFQMMGVFAQFERAMIQERVKAGLERAKAQGTKSGKAIGRPKVSPETELAILKAREEGQGIRKIAKHVGAGVGTVIRVLEGCA